MAKIGELIVSIVGDNSSLTRALDGSTKQVESFGTTVANGLASVVSFAAIAAAAVRGIEFNKAAEQAQVSFEVMTGSAETATRVLAELRDFANSTPLEFKDIRDATQTMISFGISSNNAVKYVKMLGDVSGGNADKLKSLSLSFSQVQSTGRLLGQDLLQMINAGFNPLKTISEQTGKSMSELKKEMENGAISADMVTEAFEKATGAGGMFNGMLERQGQTLAGAQSTFADALDTFLGASTAGLTAPLIELFRTLTDGAGKLGDNFESVGKMFGGLVSILTEGLKIVFAILDAIPGPIIAFGVALGVAKLAMVSIAAFAPTMGIAISSALGPIGILITALVAGVGMIAGEVNKINAENLKRETDLIAKNLGVSAEQAAKLKTISDELGISAREAQEAFANVDEKGLKTIVDRAIDLLLLNDDIEKTINDLRVQYNLSGTQVLRILEAQELLGQRTSEEIGKLRTKYQIEEAALKQRISAVDVQERGVKAAEASRAVTLKTFEEIKAQDEARKKALADERTRKAKELADEKARNRASLEDFLMTDEQKLLKEKARYLSAAKNAKEIAQIEEFYANKFLEMRERAAEEADLLKQKEQSETEKAFRDELGWIDTTNEEYVKYFREKIDNADLSAEQQKKLNDEVTENVKANVENQKKAFSDLANYIGDTLGSLADSLAELNDANLKTQLDKIEQETQAQLEAAGLKEETEVQRLERELQAAVLAGDTELAAERKRDLERQKILDNAKKKAAKAEYEAAMNAWNLKYTMAIVDAAVAVISIWAGSGSIYEKIAGSVVAVVATAASIATIEANKPQPPALWTGTANPIGEAGAFLVADGSGGGMEMILPKGADVLNNRDTINALGGSGTGATRATIQIMLDRQMIGQSTVDLINNGLIVVEAFA